MDSAHLKNNIYIYIYHYISPFKIIIPSHPSHPPPQRHLPWGIPCSWSSPGWLRRPFRPGPRRSRRRRRRIRRPRWGRCRLGPMSWRCKTVQVCRGVEWGGTELYAHNQMILKMRCLHVPLRNCKVSVRYIKVLYVLNHALTQARMAINSSPEIRSYCKDVSLGHDSPYSSIILSVTSWRLSQVAGWDGTGEPCGRCAHHFGQGLCIHAAGKFRDVIAWLGASADLCASHKAIGQKMLWFKRTHKLMLLAVLVWNMMKHTKRCSTLGSFCGISGYNRNET